MYTSEFELSETIEGWRLYKRNLPMNFSMTLLFERVLER